MVASELDFSIKRETFPIIEDQPTVPPPICTVEFRKLPSGKIEYRLLPENKTDTDFTNIKWRQMITIDEITGAVSDSNNYDGHDYNIVRWKESELHFHLFPSIYRTIHKLYPEIN